MTVLFWVKALIWFTPMLVLLNAGYPMILSYIIGILSACVMIAIEILIRINIFNQPPDYLWLRKRIFIEG